MTNIEYSPKEIAIFEGVNKLIENGVSLNSIKVSEIAKSAGIGKGTVYEYFTSKDEVIAKSLIYNINKEVKNLLENTYKETTFKDKWYALLDGMMKLTNNKFDYIQMFLSSKDFHDVIGTLNKDKNEMIQFRNYVINTLEPTIDLGIEEKNINKDLDRDYVKSVFISVLSGTVNIIHFSFDKLSEKDLKIQKDRAYTMLVKALS